jgi:predicted ArsR family transcriptional regulator
MTSTREQILHLLKTDGPMTVSDLAEKLDITEMAVRRHLNTLERDQMIGSRLLRQAMGRPTSQFYLTDKADDYFPKNYHTFALSLLEDIEETEGPEAVERLFERRKDRLTKEFQDAFRGKTWEEQVKTLAQLQDEKGYMVRLEKRSDGSYELTELNCPIAQVANRYQQACACEIGWFRNMLDADVDRTECKAKGGQHCVYVIKPKNN